MIIFVVSGFWHGANWTFIIWGLINALYFIPILLQNKNREHLTIVAKGSIFPTFFEMYQILRTFLLTLIAWIFFRAEDLGHALSYISGIISFSLFDIPNMEDMPMALIKAKIIKYSMSPKPLEKSYLYS